MKAIIFDFDGTLADTLPICYRAFQDVFRTFDGKELSDDNVRAMFGPSETDIIRKNLTNGNSVEAIELFYKSYQENHQQLVQVNNEINDMLKYLSGRGFKLGIVTGKAKRSLDISLKALHMDDSFEVMITGDDVKKPKPHPEGINRALSVLNAGSPEAMFVGDSDADIDAGNRANVRTIGVQWLPNYQTAQFTSKPDALFKDVSDFIKYIR
ncbi:pyrophosphatase PpaX [Lentibacillus halodurans]|uniref:Pyrophosphatase PpaX n=1 Tax=Lentibacillus halodurans TaxID=237679 RepID=A0A1I0Y2I3_9BACI|nr:HAD family hydrolase [Lentibacillus halodurans]SFB07525.1 pyrophosphatase PpaX [Lentibacillus halodurans]